MKKSITKGLIFLFITLIISACKEDPQQHLELGEWYAQKGLVEEAILEFKEVTRLYPEVHQNLGRNDFQALSKAHYNLSLMYTKKGWCGLCFKRSRNLFSNATN